MNGILLIAEQPDIVETFSKMLAPAYDVRCAATAEAGMAVLQQAHGAIVAVLEELALARRSAFALSEWMKAFSSFSQAGSVA